jgi:hypothetical protein
LKLSCPSIDSGIVREPLDRFGSVRLLDDHFELGASGYQADFVHHLFTGAMKRAEHYYRFGTMGRLE